MIHPEHLKAAMAAAGVSQSELARRTGLSSSMIGKLVRGEARQSAHIFELSRALGVSPEYLVGETENPGRQDIAMPNARVIAEELGMVPVRHVDLAIGMGRPSLARLFPKRSGLCRENGSTSTPAHRRTN
jgi:transcriptional regulator with XRE-family HTH domain